MKHVIILAAAAIAGAAHADPRVTKPIVESIVTNVVSKPASQASSSSVVSNAPSAASSNAVSPDIGGATLNASDSSSYRAYGLALPQPVLVPQLSSPTASCVLSTTEGASLGWGMASGSTGKQEVDVLCMAERQASAFEATCKLRTAAVLRHWIATQAARDTSLAKVLADAGAEPWVVERDLPASECRR